MSQWDNMQDVFNKARHAIELEIHASEAGSFKKALLTQALAELWESYALASVNIDWSKVA